MFILYTFLQDDEDDFDPEAGPLEDEEEGEEEEEVVQEGKKVLVY